MRSTLLALSKHPSVDLQIIATGMHLSERHGKTIRSIRADGWKVNASVPWPTSGESDVARHTGRAMAGIAGALDRLKTDIVLVVGDRVEPFAAAAAGHLAGRIVAHVHGGDRALGQVDDALRHAITKLAHLHFPATQQSKKRILKLGEDPWRVHQFGSPGIDGIAMQAGTPEIAGRFALLLLHPTDQDPGLEQQRAALIWKCVREVKFDRVVIVYPNNDPGHEGIVRCWESVGGDATIFRDIPRARFLGVMRDAAVLIGNSSSGIIEAASFGTPVIDIGPRQLGRESSRNVTHVPFDKTLIRRNCNASGMTASRCVIPAEMYTAAMAPLGASPTCLRPSKSMRNCGIN